MCSWGAAERDVVGDSWEVVEQRERAELVDSKQCTYGLAVEDTSS